MSVETIKNRTLANPANRLLQWESDDFLALTPATEIVDPWAPEPSKPRTEVSNFRALAGPDCAPTPNNGHANNTAAPTPAIHGQSASSTRDLVDAWDPLGLPVEIADNAFQFRDPWDAPLQAHLPTYDPAARSTAQHKFGFDQPLSPTARLRAHWIVAMLSPSGQRERKRLETAFSDVFTDHPDEKFFRRIRKAAADGHTGSELLTAIILKNSWAERPDLWLYRTGWRGPASAGTPGRNALTWPKALEIALRRSDFTPDEMLSDDWVYDWHGLKVRDPGFWTFAEYASLRAQENESMNHRLVWCQDAEERRWYSDAPMPNRDFSGITLSINRGVVAGNVPPAIKNQYNKWRYGEDLHATHAD